MHSMALLTLSSSCLSLPLLRYRYLWTASVSSTLSTLSLQTTLSVYRDISLRQLYSSVAYYTGFGTGFPSELSTQHDASLATLQELQFVSDVLSYSDTSSFSDLQGAMAAWVASGNVASQGEPTAASMGVPGESNRSGA